MKNPVNKNTGNRNYNRNKTSPEIRDNLDARKNEEQDYKGDDVTHNQKQHHNKSKKKNK